MADNVLTKWYAEFEARGLQDVVKATQQLGADTQRAADKHTALAKAAADPAFKKAAETLELTNQRTQRLLASETQRLSLAVRRRTVVNGAYAEEVRGLQRIAAERERVERLERRAALDARYGRIGGAAAHYGGALANSPIGGVARAGAAAVSGAAWSGFGGTVELMRFQTELQLVSRELAGVFKPALTAASRAVSAGRKWAEGRSAGEQDTMLTGGLAVGGALAAHAASKFFLKQGLGSTLAQGGKLAVGRGALGALGPLGLVMGAGALAPEYVRPNKYQGMADGQLDTELGRERQSSTWLGRRGRNTLGSLGAGVFDAVNWTQRQFTGKNYARDDYHAPATAIENEINSRKNGADRRRVTLADAGFDAVGSGFERATTALALRDAQDAEDKTTSESILGRIEEMLKVAIAQMGNPQLK